MTARGSAGQADALGGDVEFLGVPADPGDRALDVDHVVGKRGTRAEAVVDVETDPAIGREVVQQRDALLDATAGDPAAPVDLDYCGAGVVARAGLPRAVDVETQAVAVALVEDDGAFLADSSGGEHEQREREMGAGKPQAGGLAGDVPEGFVDRSGAGDAEVGEAGFEGQQKGYEGKQDQAQRRAGGSEEDESQGYEGEEDAELPGEFAGHGGCGPSEHSDVEGSGRLQCPQAPDQFELRADHVTFPSGAGDL